MKKKLVTSTIFVLLLTNLFAVAFDVVPNGAAEEGVPYEILEATGTHFELKHFNVFITTNTPVHVILCASSELMGFLIENASIATSTQLTLGTLQPLTTYYMYEDSHVNEAVFLTDDVGTYTYTQDLSRSHHVHIQQITSTIFISQSTTLQSDIYDEVVIIADNVVLNLNGHSIVGSYWSWAGIDASYRNNVTIKNGVVSNFFFAGINIVHNIEYSTNIVIHNNTITSNPLGIYVGGSHGVIIHNNTISSSQWAGIYLSTADLNTITDNTLIQNEIEILYSFDNSIYHNNFINTGVHIWFIPFSNIWDNSYPSGGNYWSYYTGADLYWGPAQDKPGSDGIGDSPYIMDNYNIDHYPLMNPWTPIETSVNVGGLDCPVVMRSDTTIDKIVATKNTLKFESSGPAGETGSINVIFPMVNTSQIKVFIDGVKLTPPPFPVISTNGTHYFIHFEFMLSTHTMVIQFAPSVPATIDIDPDTLNLASNGEFITAYIEVPGYNVTNLDLSWITLNETIHAELYPTQIRDYDGDGIPDLMVKIDRAEVVSYIMSTIGCPRFIRVTFIITCMLVDGTLFQGSDTITAVHIEPRHDRYQQSID